MTFESFLENKDSERCNGEKEDTALLQYGSGDLGSIQSPFFKVFFWVLCFLPATQKHGGKFRTCAKLSLIVNTWCLATPLLMCINTSPLEGFVLICLLFFFFFYIHSVTSPEVCGTRKKNGMNVTIKDYWNVDLSSPHHSQLNTPSPTLKGKIIFCLITMVTVSEAVVSIGHKSMCVFGGREGYCSNGYFYSKVTAPK